MRYSLTRRTMLAGLAAAALPSVGFAQANWPERDIRLVVPQPAGGAVDLFARTLAEQLQRALGKAVIVDNRPGAGGLVGAKAVSQAAPDGYTLCYVFAGLVTLQAMNPRLDLQKEFKMVARLSHAPFGLVVRADSPYKSAKELIAAVQASPGKLSFGSGGVGSAAHLAVEHMEDRLGNFKALHVPFKGAIETANAMVGGQVDFSVSLLGTVLPLLQTGKLRLLAVTSRARLVILPDVPTLNESVLPGFVFEPWGGLALPAGTPDAVVERLAQVLPGVMSSAAMKEIAQKQGGVLELVDARTMTAQMARDIPLEQALVKRLGMTMDQ